MSKKLITSILLPALLLLGCPFNDASSYYPMNTIYLKRQGANETAIVTSENERISTFYSKLETPSIAVSKQGKFVITWTDTKSGTRDIYARRFGITGMPEGEIFQVNTTSAGEQILPSVAINDNNEFIITWSTKGSEGNGYEVFARRYNSNGNYIGNEFKVNNSVLREQWISSVGMNARGSFVIVWQSNIQGGNDYAIFGQKFDAQGEQAGTEFLISSSMKGSKEVPKIAMNDSGEFVIAWKSNQNYSNSLDPKTKKFSDILAKSYDSKGMPKNEEVIVSINLGENNLPSVSMNNAGNFTVVWNAKENNSESYDIYAKSFIKNNSSTQAFKVNSLINRPDNQSKPAVAIDSNNSSIIIWNSEEANKLLNGVFLKKYKQNGQEEFPETKISSSSVCLQPDIVMDKSGSNYYVVWRQY